MTHNRSYTSATNGADHRPASPLHFAGALAVLTLLALGVRALRLGWQPLWWDEGYSIYFATEPLPRMLWLTARDIHPPLYYGLLHGWFALLASTRPETARLLSVLCGVAAVPLLAWLARLMRPDRPAVALWAALLLALSPLHLFYSQEVRMYGLALVFTLLATIAFWRWLQALTAGASAWLPAAAYVVAACLALWTLYYSGFLIAAHLLWAAVYLRRQRRAWAWPAGLALAILAIQTPWWAYTLPRLLPYVADKVVADQDTALLPWDYLLRHFLAFVGGHLVAPQPSLTALRLAGLVGLAALGLAWLPARLPASTDEPRTLRPSARQTASALAAFTLLPIAAGYLVNLRLPFFPPGGERLLLTVLPLLLLWLACGLDAGLRRTPAAALLLVPLLLAAAAGIATFYTLPRHVDHDYRPIVRYITQRSRDEDTVVALFPWQVGYWRAYGVRLPNGAWLPPQPASLDQDALVWSPALAATLDQALQRGTVWFPAPLSFGSTLPGEIETYLAQVARNAENRWFSPATRLSAWVQQPPPPTAAAEPVTLGPVTLAASAVAPTSVAAANAPVAVDLTWRGDTRDLHVALRLVDASGRSWAHRDYEPLGSFAQPDRAGTIYERLALLIPVGLPPQPYTLALGVGPRGSDRLFPTAGGRDLTPLATLQVTAPPAPLPSARLPAQTLLDPPQTSAGLRLIGFDGIPPGSAWLAGAALPFTLFVQNGLMSPGASEPLSRQLWLGLRDERDRTVTTWTGWPLPSYPVENWPAGALVQLPDVLALPATLEPGDYRVAAAFVISGDAPADASIDPTAALASIRVERRAVSHTRAAPQTTLDPPAQIGTHALLYGYAITRMPDRLLVELDWEVIQTLWPPHDIFVHLTAPNGTTLTQDDGPPITAVGAAPTGSWLPGEFLRTQHTLPLAAPLSPEETGLTLQVGLYEPTTQVRLPVSVNGSPAGDAVLLPLPAPAN